MRPMNKAHFSRSKPRSALLLSFLWVLVAIASTPVFAQDELTAIEGKVLLTGSAPFCEVVIQDRASGTTYKINGHWTRELKKLHGVIVRVRGAAAEPEAESADSESKVLLPIFLVIDYEIVDVGSGQKPFVGYLHLNGHGLTLHVRDFARPLRIRTSERLQEIFSGLVGAKLWVVGELEEGTIKVARFGVITKPPRANNP